MGLPKIKITTSKLILAFTCILITSCSNNLSQTLRKVTYPPNFEYTSGQELRSKMATLAFHMQQLEQQLQKQDKLQINRKAVSETLRNIEDIATSLKAREAGSNHPFLENTMREFVSTVSKARIATSLGQTNYYLAGKVSGACMNCHQVNR